MCGQGMLRHTLPKQAEGLEGIYVQAFNRILNQARSSCSAAACATSMSLLVQHLPLPSSC